MRSGGSLWQERRQTLLLRLKWQKDCSLTVIVTGGRLGSRSSNPSVACGPSHHRAGCCQNHGSPESGEKQAVTVLVSALPAFLLPPETSCTRSLGAKGHRSGAQALGIAPCAISEALVILPAGRNSTHAREMRI